MLGKGRRQPNRPPRWWGQPHEELGAAVFLRRPRLQPGVIGQFISCLRGFLWQAVARGQGRKVAPEKSLCGAVGGSRRSGGLRDVAKVRKVGQGCRGNGVPEKYFW